MAENENDSATPNLGRPGDLASSPHPSADAPAATAAAHDDESSRVTEQVPIDDDAVPRKQRSSSGRQPRVFVSSTVYDFRDLRSALRFWLTELGFDAQLSDHNDFDKQLDVDSYNACLRTVETADYFVLFIGSRIGGWYDASKRISITRREYQCAYEAFIKTGKPRIVTFVRSDIWAIKEDRQALETLLAKDASISKENKAKLVSHASKVVNDAAATFEFIDEVTRKEEMKAATARGGGFPRGNWVHSFADFSEIVTTLRRDIGLGSIQRASVVANLRDELVTIASELVDATKRVRHPLPYHSWIAGVRSRFGNELRGSMSVTGKELTQLAMFGIGAFSSHLGMTTSAIDEALRCGQFLEWDAEVHAFVPSALHESLSRLRDEIARLRRSERARVAMPDEWTTAWRTKPDELFEVSREDLLPFVSVHDRNANILTLAAAIHSALCDDGVINLDHLRLWPPTPLGGDKGPINAGWRQRSKISVWLEFEDRAARASAEGTNESQ